METNALVSQEAQRFPQTLDELPKMEFLSRDIDVILKKYDSIIMEDNLLIAKQDFKEIKEIKKGIKTAEKALVAEMEKPIRELKSQFETFLIKCSQAENIISERINVFTEQEKDKLRDVLILEIQKKLRRLFLDTELANQVFIDDLLKSPSKCLTKTMALTKFAREEIELRIEKFHSQETIETKNVPENSSQISTTHDAPKKEEKQLRKQETQLQAIHQQDLIVANSVSVPQVSNTQSSGKKIKRKIIAVFQLEVDEGISDEILEARFRQKILNSGFLSLSSVTVM